MQRLVAVAALLLLFAGLATPARAAKSEKAAAYNIDWIYVADSKPSRFMWLIRESPYAVYSSLKSADLRSWVSGLPPGSTITFSPGCIRRGGEPDAEVPEFVTFCKSKHVEMIIVPSG